MKELAEDRLYSLIRSLDAEFMEIAFIDRNEGFIGKPHSHEWFDISFVMKGSIKYEIDGQLYCVSAGDVVVIGPGKYHKEICESDSQFEVLFVCVKFINNGEAFDIAGHLNIPEVTKIVNLKEVYDIFECILGEVTYREEGYLLKVNAQIYNLLVAISRNETNVDRKINNIKRLSNYRKKKITDDIMGYIGCNYMQKISLNGLSRIFFLSPQYISSIFKKQSGYTPVEYLNKIRIEKARELFMNGECNIGKVAEEVGIGDIHYFYKVFKQFEKNTPAQFIAGKLKNT
jgi:AraC-type DNA-binding domain-containing proteins